MSDNSLRRKISEKCKDYGLSRLQKSAFFGNLSLNDAQMLGIEIEDVMKDKNGSKDCIFILPTCDSCVGKKITVGKDFDENLFRTKVLAIIR
ncbi:MAG: CRISPR-associated endonuclease Cas2 [Candidatus Methanoperedens sp.]|nr:CRISPR-associated endonuclease Cas2 [Candidatus Methanoperedens sp.]